MLPSNKMGGLPWLTIFDCEPFVAALIVFAVDFGIICGLMWLEGTPPWERTHYKTFLWNDTIFIPLYVGVAVVVMQSSPTLHGFFTERWWHIGVLCFGFVFSFSLEWDALKNGQYTWKQELSPSKLWHTFVFGIMFYWLVSSIIPVLVAVVRVTHGPMLFALIVVAICGFLYNTIRDAMLPWPKDARMEGSWRTWDWHPRQYPPWLSGKVR